MKYLIFTLLLLPVFMIACEEKPLVQRKDQPSQTQPSDTTQELDTSDLYQFLNPMVKDENFDLEAAESAYQQLLTVPVNRSFLFFTTIHLKNQQLAFYPDDPSESQPLSHLIHQIALRRIYDDKDWSDPENPPTTNPKLDNKVALAKLIELYGYDIDEIRKHRDDQ